MLTTENSWFENYATFASESLADPPENRDDALYDMRLSIAIALLVTFLAAAGIVFIGAFGHATSIAWGTPPEEARPQPAGPVDALLVVFPLALLLLLGLWMPQPLRDVF